MDEEYNMNDAQEYDEWGLEDALTVSLGFDAKFAEVATASDMHVGTREYQQDSLFVTDTVFSGPEGALKAFGVLCDGMGGMKNGELASSLAVRRLAEDMDALDSDEGIAEFFKNEIMTLDSLVAAECGGEDGAGAGTTLTAAIIFEDRLHWASVGDSRIYLIRGEDIAQVNRDHNYRKMILAEHVRQGRMTAEEADQHPRRDALVSFLGAGCVRYMDVNSAPFKLLHGDVTLLCSDGLTKSLTDEEIKDTVLENYGDLNAAARALTLGAFDKGDGSKDNTSVILMQYFE
jgi:protein phosphatase